VFGEGEGFYFIGIRGEFEGKYYVKERYTNFS